MKPLFAILAVVLAMPASALARPVDPSQVRGGSLAASTTLTAPKPDLRAPDQQSPRVHVAAVQARGTDVAAPDQQSGQTPVTVPVAVPHADGFDWSAAGIGAATGIALLIVLLGTGFSLRQRQARRPSATIG